MPTLLEKEVHLLKRPCPGRARATLLHERGASFGLEKRHPAGKDFFRKTGPCNSNERKISKVSVLLGSGTEKKENPFKARNLRGLAQLRKKSPYTTDMTLLRGERKPHFGKGPS